MERAKVLAVLERDPTRSWPLKELMSAAGLHDGREKTVRRVMKGLVAEGVVDREPDRRFRMSRVGQTVEGVVRPGARGWLEVVADGAARRAIGIPFAKQDADALREGDRVLARIERAKNGTTTAKLVELRSGARGGALGVLRMMGKAVFIEPEDRRARPLMVDPPPTEPGAADGMIVRYEIVRPQTRNHAAVAKVAEVIGRPGERETELRRLIMEFDLPERFPPGVEEAAARFGHAPDPQEVARRKDLRSLPLVTIDGENARDFDDAVAVEREGDGFKLYVAIADVAHYVQDKDPLDAEALRRGTSTYFTDRVFPMLPEALSNELCSLKPNVERLCVVAEVKLDREGHVTGSSFYRSVMRSRARLTYTQVAHALDGETDQVTGPLLPSLLLLHKVAELRLRLRLIRGAIDLDLPESEILFDREGLPADAVQRDRNDAHRLIEDLMLTANEAVAAYFEDRDLPTIFRNHDDPDPLKLEAFVELCGRLGFPVKLKRNKIRPKDVALLLEEISAHPSGKHLHALLLRTLAQARYYPENEGHFGLAAERYLHFTSPIRRYPDLMVHRLLTAHLEGRPTGHGLQELTTIAEQCSNNERRAALAERACRDLDRSYVALLHLGEELDGTVTGIQPFGVFVAVEKPFIEGMIPIQMLGGEYWEYDDRASILIGAKSGRQIHLGLRLKVEVARVSIQQRQVELRPAEVEEDQETMVESTFPRLERREDDRASRFHGLDRPQRKEGVRGKKLGGPKLRAAGDGRVAESPRKKGGAKKVRAPGKRRGRR